MSTRPLGFNLIGHASANAGVGVATRALATTILESGHDLAILDIDPGHGRSKQDLSLAPYFVDRAEDLPYAINISTSSIVSLPYLIFDHPQVFATDAINVGYFWWELSKIPYLWKKSLEVFDVLLAGSDFLYSAYSQSVDDVFHLKINHKPCFPAGISPNRMRFSIPEDEFTFICILEPTSDPVRKNPYSAIRAFQAAFMNNERVRLIIKINNVAAFSHDDRSYQLLLHYAESDHRIVLFTQQLSYLETLSLYASCDAFVALHRSEGLGLGIMEAMWLSKPVIATAWSGNMNFTDHTNSCLVRYKLVKVEGSIRVYQEDFLGSDAHWADPNVEDASLWMKTLASRPELSRQIGDAARASVLNHITQTQDPIWIRELLAMQESGVIRTGPTAKAEKIGELKRSYADHGRSPYARLLSETHQLLDRHLLWRLRKHRG